MFAFIGFIFWVFIYWCIFRIAIWTIGQFSPSTAASIRSEARGPEIFALVAALASFAGPVVATQTWSTLGIAGVGVPLFIVGIAGFLFTLFVKKDAQYRWAILMVMGAFWLIIPLLAPDMPEIKAATDTTQKVVVNSGGVFWYIIGSIGAFFQSLIFWAVLTGITLFARSKRWGKLRNRASDRL